VDHCSPYERNLGKEQGSAPLLVEDDRGTPTFFVLGQGTSRVVYEALGINEPDAFTSLIVREALELEEAQQLLSNSDASGTSSEEEDPLLRERQTRSSSRQFRRVDEAGQDDSSGPLIERRRTGDKGRDIETGLGRVQTLDIIVERRVFVAIAIQVFESVVCREVLGKHVR
jgi:hypothetical protein